MIVPPAHVVLIPESFAFNARYDRFRVFVLLLDLYSCDVCSEVSTWNIRI
jgi:hypothetical protein